MRQCSHGIGSQWGGMGLSHKDQTLVDLYPEVCDNGLTE